MLKGLKIYTVHNKPGSRVQEDMPLFIRDGFNIFAFVFTLFWALYHRLWKVAALVFAFNVGVGFMQEAGFISEASGVVLLLAAQIFMGLEGNDWRRAALQKRGYITEGIVTGDSLLRAEQRYFDQRVAA